MLRGGREYFVPPGSRYLVLIDRSTAVVRSPNGRIRVWTGRGELANIPRESQKVLQAYFLASPDTILVEPPSDT
jgi:hypothetical protein